MKHLIHHQFTDVNTRKDINAKLLWSIWIRIPQASQVLRSQQNTTLANQKSFIDSPNNGDSANIAMLFPNKKNMGELQVIKNCQGQWWKSWGPSWVPQLIAITVGSPPTKVYWSPTTTGLVHNKQISSQRNALDKSSPAIVIKTSEFTWQRKNCLQTSKVESTDTLWFDQFEFNKLSKSHRSHLETVTRSQGQTKSKAKTELESNSHS